MVNQWLDRVSVAFPEYRTRLTCFGYDWLGRVFALDSTRSEEGQSGVILLEPGTGESLIIPANLETFHSKELQVRGEAALAISFYNKGSAGAPSIARNCPGPALSSSARQPAVHGALGNSSMTGATAPGRPASRIASRIVTAGQMQRRKRNSPGCTEEQDPAHAGPRQERYDRDLSARRA
jgi:hypothetical protein